MKRLNKKGFTLVELLAVITILGIVMAVAAGAVMIYLTNSRQQAMDQIASSAYDGAVMYWMDENLLLNEGEERTVDINTLYEDQRIDIPSDPYNTTTTCKGEVKVENPSGSTGGLNNYQYTVKIDCAGDHDKTYKFPKE